MCAGAPADRELRSGPPAAAAAARPPRHVTAELRRSVPPGHGAAGCGRWAPGRRGGGLGGSATEREGAAKRRGGGGNWPLRGTEGYAGNDVTYHTRTAAGLRGAGAPGARRKAGGEGMQAGKGAGCGPGWKAEISPLHRAGSKEVGRKVRQNRCSVWFVLAFNEI